MRPWRIRLAARRSRTQWALLSVVLLVSVLSATLLGALFYLTHATETFAARAATSELPESQTRLVHRLVPNSDAELSDAIAGSASAAAELFGETPFTTRLHAESQLFMVPRPDLPEAMSYASTYDVYSDNATLLDGRWPADAPGDAVEVTVPPRFLWETELEIGDTITVWRAGSPSATTDLLIVGTYVADTANPEAWRLDRYRGVSFRPNQDVPYTGGLIVTTGIGAVITAPQDIERFDLSTINVEHIPDFAGASIHELRHVVDATADAGRVAQREIAANSKGITVLTQVDQTLGAVVGSLAITNSSVLVTALLLLVLAIAALSQTARLMAERRHAEQHLMIARGGAIRQMFSVGILEAFGLGVATAAAAAPLARLAYLNIAAVPEMDQAGMNLDPGLPVGVWVVTGIVGLALVVVLVAPLMRRTGSFVDAEQAKSRPGRRAAFQRSGLDLGVVVLAALAYWQLRTYRSPVLDGGGVASVDPLLSAGPALALLAGGLVAVRLIPATSKMFERVATNGRRATLPLASWEVGRRAARAVSAVLLLTLAVSIGTFSLAFLSTWKQSQQDQARFLHPADAVLTGVDSPWPTQAAEVAAAFPQAEAYPMVLQNVELGPAPTSTRGSSANNRFRGTPAFLFASTADGMRFFGQDRLSEYGGSRVASSLGHTVQDESQPIELPGRPEGVRMEVAVNGLNGAIEGGITDISLVLRDANGQYFTVPLGRAAMDGEPRVLTAFIGDSASAANMAFPISLVGLQSFMYADGSVLLNASGQLGLTVTIEIDEIRTITEVTAIPVVGVPGLAQEQPVPIDGVVSWYAQGDRLVPQRAVPDELEGQILASAITTPTNLMGQGARLTLTSVPVQGLIPIVASSAALDGQGIENGDEVRLSINGILFEGYIANRLPRLAGDALRSAAVAVNFEQLQLTLIQRGLPPLEPTEWWLAGESEEAFEFSTGTPSDWEVSTRDGLAREFSLDPLRIGIQAALWIVAAAAAVLAAVGFAVHSVVTVRAREIEFAQLRAVGVQRSQLLRMVTYESSLLAVLGTIFGVGLGAALAYLVAPLVSVGSDGRSPIPPVEVLLPWSTIALLAVEVLAVVVVTTVIVAAMLRRINPAQMLRMGDER